ncbi:MAG: hypothetical protein R2911_33975 [Caldilineaceae bacterium]
MRKYTKYIHEGEYVAQVEVELIDTNDGWSPYLSLTDAYRLDDIRRALRLGDIARAAKMAQVFTLTPVAA